MKVAIWFIIPLVALGLFARLFQLSHLPAHLSNDEISIAYDAYSLSRTGRDEHGIALPLAFKSHGTYKAPMYSYLLVPFTTAFGNTDLVARLPSVVSGLLTVFIVSLISYLLTHSKPLAVICFTIAITTPWHIFTSRMVYEANIGLLFLALGVLLFLKSQPSTAGLFLSLAMYSYHTQWLLCPVLIVAMMVHKQSNKLLLVFVLVSSLLGFNFLANLHTGARANTEMLWSEIPITHLAPFIQTFLSHYFSYTNPGYLFFSGLNLFGSPNPYQVGLFLWPLLLSMIIGLLVSKRYLQPAFRPFFLFWLLVSPIVPALTKGDPSLVRNLVSFLPYLIVCAIGTLHLYIMFKRLFYLLCVCYLCSLAYFSVIYLHHYSQNIAASFQSYKLLAYWLQTHQADYSDILVDDHFGPNQAYVGVPHVYLGYYLPLPPQVLQNRVYTPGQVHYASYTITSLNWSSIQPSSATLYISGAGNPPPNSLSPHLTLEKTVPDAAGNPALQAWSYQL